MNDLSEPLRIVGVEEHVDFPWLTSRLPEAPAIDRGFLSRDMPFGKASNGDKLADTEQRLQALDASGVTVQILSHAGPGAELLAPKPARNWARRANEALAQRVAAHPDRYAGLAHLPLVDPDAAVDELDRTVSELRFKGALIDGSTNGRYLDHPTFEPLLSRAEALDVPLYLHPAPSPKLARDVLYGGLPGDFSFWMGVSGWGWHADTAVHVLRLLLSGVLQRHPGLKIVIGHQGEGLQTMIARLDQQFHQFAGFDAVPSEVLRRHLWVSMSGFFVMPSFMAALDAFGADRLLYSVDYPFGSLSQGRAFLDQLPVDGPTLAKIAHVNADQLFKLDV